MDAFRFSLAQPEDIDVLSRLFWNFSQEDGGPPFTLEPESSFWSLMGIRGEEWKVIVGRRESDGAVVGFCSVSERPLYLGGVPTPVTYVPSLFLDRAARGGVLLRRGSEALRETGFPEGRIGQSVVMAGNERALRIFTAGKDWLPTFYPIGKQVWHLMRLDQGDPRRASEFEIRRACADDLGLMQAFHDEWAPTKALFPRYDFSRLGQPYYRDLAPGDFFLAFRRGRLAGMVGMWDQAGIRHLLFLEGQGADGKLVPGPRVLYLHSLLTENNAPDVADHLIAAVRADRTGSGFDVVRLTLDTEDPLRGGLERHSVLSTELNHFLVSYEGGDPRPRVGAGPYYFEGARN